MRLLRARALEVPFPAGGYEAETRRLEHCLLAGMRVSWLTIPAVYEGAPGAFSPSPTAWPCFARYGGPGR